MPSFVSLAVAVVSALAAVASLLLYVHSSRRDDQDSARAEALALAETRAQTIAELRAALRSLERAYQAQCYSTTAFAEVLAGVHGDLEEAPPDVEAALTRIRALLAAAEPRIYRG
jgi:DNA repair ATPase RecN